MRDIKYNGNNLVLKDGDLALVDKKDRVTQQVITGLKILKGDWFLDYRKGIDYINGMKAFPNILKSEIKNAIQEVNGVDNVRDYTFKNLDNKYFVNATVLVDNQEFYLSEEYSL